MSSPVDYETPEGGSPHRAGVFDLNTFFRSAILVGAFIVIMLFVVPRFEDVFRDFKMELPETTKLLLATSRATAGGWWVALLTIPPGLGFLVAQFGPAGRRLARMGVMLLLGALVLFVALGIFMPMLAFFEAMSPKK